MRRIWSSPPLPSVGMHFEGPGAHPLSGANLDGAHLERADLDGAQLASANLLRAYLADATLEEARLERVNLRGAQLAGAYLEKTQLAGADLRGAQLTGAYLRGANLAGKRLPSDELTQVRKVLADFPDLLPPADLRYAFLDTSTTLVEVTLGDGDLGFVALADVRWGGANLAVVPWARIPGQPPRKRLTWVMLGDEREAREAKDSEGQKKDAATRLSEFEAAVRANRQLAVVLRDQGVNDDADRFAYQAQVLQRTVLWRQGRYGAAFFSWVLDRIAGHGYKPGRTVLWYLAVIAAFALTYYLLGPGEGHAFSPQGALVFSVTSFHGRGFFPGSLSLEDLVTQLAAIQAVFGLFIEVSFIATFTQRFFAR
jgi:Pentapeptide repeats (8 copies)